MIVSTRLALSSQVGSAERIVEEILQSSTCRSENPSHETVIGTVVGKTSLLRFSPRIRDAHRLDRRSRRVAKVPDPRLDAPAKNFEPPKITTCLVEYLDVPAVSKGPCATPPASPPAWWTPSPTCCARSRQTILTSTAR